MIKKGLGKGLDAFFPPLTNATKEETDAVKTKVELSDNTNDVNEIDIDLIITNSKQPRKVFEQAAIEELSESIKKYGVIQPVVLTKNESKYDLIAGERRLRAAKLAGLNKIPAIIKEYDEKSKSEIALIENIQRKNLNVLEEAQAYKDILDKYEISQEELAKSLGKSRSSISNSIRILKFNDNIKKYILNNEISEGHCKVLASVEDEVLQNSLAKKIVADGMSVRKLEEYIKGNDEVVTKTKKNIVPNVWIQDIEEKFKDFFQTKVKIKADTKNKKGKIIVEYYSNEELDRILESINGR